MSRVASTLAASLGFAVTACSEPAAMPSNGDAITAADATWLADTPTLADAPPLDLAPDLAPKPACTAGARRCHATDPRIVEACKAGQWVQHEVCDGKSFQCGPQATCQDACEVGLQDPARGSLGCRFWPLDLDNAFVPGSSNSAGGPYAVIVVNPSEFLAPVPEFATVEGLVTLDASLQPLDLSPLKPLESRTFWLPQRDINGTSITWNSYRLTTTAPVAAYQFNPLSVQDVYSSEASVLLPDDRLGTEHVVLTREQSFDILRGFLTVVATRSGKTQVTVTFGAATSKTLPSLDDNATNAIPSYKAGESATFTLKQWQVLNIETDLVGADLTGSRITATQPVAVFGGSEAANAPETNHCLTGNCTDGQLQNGDKCGVCAGDGKTACAHNGHCAAFITCCADHLEEQMPPLPVLGWQHVCVKFFPREDEGDLWRIVALQDGTQLEFDPLPKDMAGKPIAVPKPLAANAWFEIETRDSFEVRARLPDGSKAPVLVGHFMASQDAPGPGKQPGQAGTGDPSQSHAVAVAQWQARYFFTAPPLFAFSYVSIAAPVGTQVLLDDVNVPSSLWKPLNAKWQFARMFVQPGAHEVLALPATGEPRKVQVEVYGWDQYVSYAYPAGLGLDPTAN